VSSAPNLAQRFRHGKEIFISLVGILGTIVGFYFGQSTDAIPDFEIGPAYATAVPVGDGNNIMITAFAHGGRAPYAYKIEFKPDTISGMDQRVSSNGLIAATVPTKTVGAFSYTITATDSSGRKATYDSAKSGDELKLKKSEKK
jgi:hypothetical protein